MNSILDTIKKMLGLDDTLDAFDVDILVHINSAFTVLYQLGVGKATPFSISDGTKKWSDFLESNLDIEAVKSYIYLKVKLAFDPPQNSFSIDAINRQINELEWRLTAIAESEL